MLSVQISRTIMLIVMSISIVITTPPWSLGCTAYVLESKGRVLFCEGFDWHSGQGMVVINKQGFSKKSVINEVLGKQPLTWTSLYGSVTFTWIGISMPTCGMNSEGLAITALIHSNSILPIQDDRPEISISQWKQYVLDTCRTVDEALDSLHHLRLTTLSRFGVHYLLADASGKAAIIQFIDSKPRIFMDKDLPYPALTNDLDYTQILKNQQKQPLLDGFKEQGGSFSYQTRFQRAAQIIRQSQKAKQADLDELAWQIFDQVRVSGFTRWNIVFDLQNRTVLFRTDEHESLRRIDLKAANLSCRQPVMILDINAPLNGDVTHRFKSWSQSQLPGIILDRADQIIRMSPTTRRIIRQYPTALRCRQSSDTE